MKKSIHKIAVAAFLLALPILMVAQNPPHPNGGNAPGGGNTPVGGGSPIDGGLSIMLLAGAAYGARRVYKATKQ